MDDSKPPMAAVPNPLRPPGQPAPSALPNQPRVQMYMPPSTPAEVAREKERIALLLEINQELTAHLNKLQVEGHGGEMKTIAQAQAQAQAQSPTTQTTPSGTGSAGGTPPVTPTTSTKVASPEYTRCMRWFQANLQYLLATSGNTTTKSPIGPAFMDPPISTPRVVELYDKLKALFPGWRGLQAAMQAMAQQAHLARKASGDSTVAGAGVGGGAVPGGQIPSQAQMPVSNANNAGAAAAMEWQMSGTSAGAAPAMTAQAAPVQRNIHTPPSHILSGVQPPVQARGDGTSNPQYQSLNIEGQDAGPLLGQQNSWQSMAQAMPLQGSNQEQRDTSENGGAMTGNTFMQHPT